MKKKVPLHNFLKWNFRLYLNVAFLFGWFLNSHYKTLKFLKCVLSMGIWMGIGGRLILNMRYSDHVHTLITMMSDNNFSEFRETLWIALSKQSSKEWFTYFEFQFYSIMTHAMHFWKVINHRKMKPKMQVLYMSKILIFFQ